MVRNKIRINFWVVFLGCLWMNHNYVGCDTVVDGTQDSYSYTYELDMDEVVTCIDDEHCKDEYTPNIGYAISKNSTFVRLPHCVNMTCTCKPFCLSRSLTTSKEEFYYCGPCGRVGSACDELRSCSSSVGECKDGFCKCIDNGDFYEMYYCYIPYYGYEIALQMAISTCIIIALCILVASIYNAIGFRRIREMQGIRQLFGSEGVRESPPDDIPPKYDDVVEDLPSYQDAMKIYERSGRKWAEGSVNFGFERDESVRSKIRTPRVEENSASEIPSTSVQVDVYEDPHPLSSEGSSSLDDNICNRCRHADDGSNLNLESNVTVEINGEVHNINERKDYQKVQLGDSSDPSRTLNDGVEYSEISVNDKSVRSKHENEHIINQIPSANDNTKAKISVDQRHVTSINITTDVEDEVGINVQYINVEPKKSFQTTNRIPTESKSHSSVKTANEIEMDVIQKKQNDHSINDQTQKQEMDNLNKKNNSFNDDESSV